MKYNNFDITKIYYSGHSITSAYGCGGYKVFDTITTPKIQITYSNGDVYSAACDGNTSLTSNDTQPEGYNYYEMASAVIGNCVTSVDNDAFSFNTVVSSITIPDSVTSIGDRAFYYCRSITAITIPSGVISIGHSAFEGCMNSVSITVEALVPPTLGSGAFAYTNCPIYIPCQSLELYQTAWSAYASRLQCITPPTPTGATKLTMVNNSGSTYTIDCNDSGTITRDDWVWGYFDEYGVGARYTVTDVVIGDCTTTIGNECFQYLEALTSLTISRNVTTIGNEAFGGCNALQSLYLHSGITSMGMDVFANCSSLTSVTFEQGLTIIGNGAFIYCPNLTSVTIPSSVETIGEDVFNYCQRLALVRVEAQTPPALGHSAFYDTSNDLVILVPQTSVETYKTTDGWKEYTDRIVGY